MSHTNSLEKLVQSRLSAVLPRCTQPPASDSAEFPYITWELASVELGDLNREDVLLDVSIWYKSGVHTQEEANEISDSVAAALHRQNLPQEDILPTFYRYSRQNLPDEDKSIRRILLQFQIQVYDKE